jgi:hypothetical protein
VGALWEQVKGGQGHYSVVALKRERFEEVMSLPMTAWTSVIPGLKEWLATRCDKRTGVENAFLENMINRIFSRLTAAERSIYDKMLDKMGEINSCEFETLDDLSGNQMHNEAPVDSPFAIP